jgi:hypothetical protein
MLIIDCADDGDGDVGGGGGGSGGGGGAAAAAASAAVVVVLMVAMLMHAILPPRYSCLEQHRKELSPACRKAEYSVGAAVL